jgi:hypothetical protein
MRQFAPLQLFIESWYFIPMWLNQTANSGEQALTLPPAPLPGIAINTPSLYTPPPPSPSRRITDNRTKKKVREVDIFLFCIFFLFIFLFSLDNSAWRHKFLFSGR